MAPREPVKDWKTDYDIFAQEYIKDPFPVWDELRESCPVAHTERWGGSWMPTRYADLFMNMYDQDYVNGFDSMNQWMSQLGDYPQEAFVQFTRDFMKHNKLYKGQMKFRGKLALRPQSFLIGR